MEKDLDLRKENRSFLYSERLKSNVFLSASAINILEGLKAEKLEGGKKVTQAVLLAFRKELNIAGQHLPAEEISVIENKILEASQEVESHRFSQARQRLAEALSKITTMSDRFMRVLERCDLI